MNKRNGTTRAPVLIPTLEGSAIATDAIAIIYALDEALDPYTPPHKAIAVQSMAGPIVRVRADELRKIFGTRRRRGSPPPVGHARPGDVK